MSDTATASTPAASPETNEIKILLREYLFMYLPRNIMI
jgi:hypothetical protein